MATILGLDIGVNSIGWALIEEGKRIIDIGSRIFPEGLDKYGSAKEITHNAQRRASRQARRRRARYLLRRERLVKLLTDRGMMPDFEDLLDSAELYHLRKKGLDEQLTLREFGRILFMLNKRRGFRSSKKDKAVKFVDGKEQEDKELQGVKLEMEQLEQDIKSAGCRTVGEYFALLFEKEEHLNKNAQPQKPFERIRKRWVKRSQYVEEFNALWSAQQKFYPRLLTEELRKEVRDRIIYFQRPLRSQKHLVGKCTFESGKRCAPRSSFEFQEYRIWQQLANIRVTAGDRINDGLTLEEKRKLATAMATLDKLGRKSLKSLLGLPPLASLNDMPDLRGNITAFRMMIAVGKELYASMDEGTRFSAWHALLYAQDEVWLKEYAVNRLRLPLEQAEAYAGTTLEDGFCNLSSKAMKKILPHLREGMQLSDAIEAAGYDHSDPRNMLERAGARAKVDALEPNELRSPLVQQAVSETIRLVNAVIEKYGKPDSIHIEMARELRKPKRVRMEALYRNRDKEKRREQYREFLGKKLRRAVTKDDITKYELWLELGADGDMKDFSDFTEKVRPGDEKKFKLWLECGRISPYSGKVISFSRLFSPAIEIEHIHPYSRTMDNTFSNLTLCERDLNLEKLGRTPAEFFRTKGKDAWMKFAERVKEMKSLSKAKKWRFLEAEVPDEFSEAQLRLTSYIAVRTRQQLLQVCRDVRATSGGVTAILRRSWNLNKILAGDEALQEKSRDDHRHHAIDALVIALTSSALIHTIGKLSKRQVVDEYGRIHLKGLPLPWPRFVPEAREKIGGIIVSYRQQRRLLVKRKNSIRVKEGEKRKYPSLAIRGQMHEETHYGKIQLPGTDDTAFVVRKPVSSITSEKHFEAVVDPVVRKILRKRLKKYAGNFKAAFADDAKDPLLMPNEKGLNIPIRKVRMQVESTTMTLIREKKSPTYVEPGNNFLYVLYGSHEAEKKDALIITFMEAVQKRLRGEPLYPQELNGKPLLYTLTQGDLVVVYENHPDEIEWGAPELNRKIYLVNKFDQNKNINLGMAMLSNIKDDKDPPPIVLRRRPSTLKVVKIKVDETGKIVRQ